MFANTLETKHSMDYLTAELRSLQIISNHVIINKHTHIAKNCNSLKQRHYFANKGPSSQGYSFSRGHVWMWELGCEKAEHWRIDAFLLWCWRWLFWTARRSNQSILKEISPGISLEGMMLKLLWPPDAKSWLTGKHSDAGGDWGQEEKGTTEDEMAGRHHWLNGRESEWTPGVGDVQGGLTCCDSWGRKESDTTERLNWTEDKH